MSYKSYWTLWILNSNYVKHTVHICFISLMQALINASQKYFANLCVQISAIILSLYHSVLLQLNIQTFGKHNKLYHYITKRTSIRYELKNQSLLHVYIIFKRPKKSYWTSLLWKNNNVKYTSVKICFISLMQALINTSQKCSANLCSLISAVTLSPRSSLLF